MDLNGKKILISSCGGLGDLIMFTPALRRMKEKYPNCHITFMTAEKHKAVLSGLSYIDSVICIRRGKFLGRYRVLPCLFQQNAVIFTDWQPQLLFFSWLFHVPVRAGIPKPGHELCKYFTRSLKNNVFRYTQYAAKTNAMVFEEALEIELDGPMSRCDVSQPVESDIKCADDLLQKIGIHKNEKFMILTPFTGLEQRNWPIDAAGSFVQKVKSRLNIPVVVIGTPDKRLESEQISSFNLVGKTTILQMVELIRRAVILVTPDSGPMHIAGAVGTKTVALFSKDLPERWAPKKKCRAITLHMPCSPCDDDTARACKTVQCMRGITADQVFEACQELLHEDV